MKTSVMGLICCLLPAAAWAQAQQPAAQPYPNYQIQKAPSFFEPAEYSAEAPAEPTKVAEQVEVDERPVRTASLTATFGIPFLRWMAEIQCDKDEADACIQCEATCLNGAGGHKCPVCVSETSKACQEECVDCPLVFEISDGSGPNGRCGTSLLNWIRQNNTETCEKACECPDCPAACEAKSCQASSCRARATEAGKLSKCSEACDSSQCQAGVCQTGKCSESVCQTGNCVQGCQTAKCGECQAGQYGSVCQGEWKPASGPNYDVARRQPVPMYPTTPFPGLPLPPGPPLPQGYAAPVYSGHPGDTFTFLGTPACTPCPSPALAFHPGHPSFVAACACGANCQCATGCKCGANCQCGGKATSAQLTELQRAMIEVRVLQKTVELQKQSEQQHRAMAEALVEARTQKAQLEVQVAMMHERQQLQQQLTETRAQLAQAHSVSRKSTTDKVDQVLAENASLKKKVAELEQLIRTQAAYQNARSVR